MNMGRRPQRYRGVRQRHWGSWVSEIRHPTLKTRIWLGTFETEEDAARTYDEVARLMCGPKARTNFSYDPDLPSSTSKFLSTALMEKLCSCHLESLQGSQLSIKRTPMGPLSDGGNHRRSDNIRARWKTAKNNKQFNCLDDEQIQEMINELLDTGSMELRSEAQAFD